MNIAWAYSICTIQYIDGELYGTTVLGGNILKVDRNGVIKIIWENDYANQSEGGVFLYSVLYNDNLYFFPYMSGFIVVYNITSETIEKIPFRCKEAEEKIFAYVFHDMIYMFGLSSGRVWKLRGTEIEIINEKYKPINELSKYRKVFEDNRLFFFQNNSSTGMIYDCLSNSWEQIKFSSIIEDGYVSGDEIWLLEKGNLHCYSKKTNKDEFVISGSGEESSSYILQVDENRLLMFDSIAKKIYKIEMNTRSVEQVKEKILFDNTIQWGIELGGGISLLIDINNLDWMLRGNEKYLLLEMESMTIKEIPMFNMALTTKELINERYSCIAWRISQDNLISENNNEDLPFLIDSINMGIFED